MFSGGGTAGLAIGTAPGGAVAGVITVQAGAAIIGYGGITGALVDNGTIATTGGTLILASVVSGTGSLAIDAGATLDAKAAVTVADTVFAGGSATLILGSPKTFAATIAGFGAGDRIDLAKLKVSALSFSGGALTLTNGNTVVETLHFAGDFNAANFALGSDGQGGALISFTATPGAQDFVPSDFAAPALDVTPSEAAHGAGPANDWYESAVHAVLGSGHVTAW